ncbi:MAG TPA: hypothetical protein VFO89_07810 [Thermoanaerobaculia bacterium]|nr:hypothetical protein [Thermoanaerobaculia bacterium]
MSLNFRVCEICDIKTAVAFALIGPVGSHGSWKLSCVTCHEDEEYGIKFTEFFRSPEETIEWLAQLAEKSWIDWADFIRMILRLRGADVSLTDTHVPN